MNKPENVNERMAVTVYGASSSKIDTAYIDAARELGSAIAEKGYTLVNGGGRGGLMAASIEGALSRHGECVGVLPQFMVDRQWNHPMLTKMVVTESMHERKSLMASLSRAAVALPGGVGTLEELLEIITWRQLGLYPGHVIIYNVNGYFDPLIQMLERSIEQKFMNEDRRSLFHVLESVDEIMDIIAEPAEINLLNNQRL